jgi:hypothetical protein
MCLNQDERKKTRPILKANFVTLRYVSESYVDGLLTKMRSSLWLLDFHDLEE